MTNQVMADPGGMTFAGADNRKAVCTHRLPQRCAVALARARRDDAARRWAATC